MKPPKIDITLEESYNQYYLAIKDISEYDESWTVSNTSCEITVPGFPKINVPFTAKSTNYYKSDQLNLTCGTEEDCIPLPDGVYTVKYSVHPNNLYFVEKSFMRTNLIRCAYSDAFIKVDFSDHCNREQKNLDKKYLYNVNVLIEGSTAAANNCVVEKAYKYYSKAKQLLDSFHKQGCGCSK